jgi:NAD(P)-dependent dehydrogenase (short-subunit alcohol dehydrogenase family)
LPSAKFHNLKATFFCCQQGTLLMKKAGVSMLTRALAKAFAPEITVNSVAPGVILASDQAPRAQELIAATPAKRSGTAEEIADTVLYFWNASNFVTGPVLAIDGPLSQR